MHPGHRTWSRAARLATLVLLSALTPTVALAAKPGKVAEPPADAVAREATRRFKEGDFAIAGDLFLRAWELAHRPTFLFNCARAYEKAGDKKAAIQRFREYLHVSDDVAGREEAQLRAARLEKELGPAQPMPARPSVPAQPPVPAQTPVPVPVSPPARALVETPAPVAAPPKAVVSASVPAPNARRTPVVPPAAPDNDGQSTRPAGWALVAVGVVLGATGAGLWWRAGVLEDDLRRRLNDRYPDGRVRGVTQNDAVALNNTIGTEKTLGVAAGAIGGVSLITGIVLAARSPNRPQTLAFSPWIDPSGAAIGGTLGGRW